MPCFTFLVIMEGGLENKLEHFDVTHGHLGVYELMWFTEILECMSKSNNNNNKMACALYFG